LEIVRTERAQLRGNRPILDQYRSRRRRLGVDNFSSQDLNLSIQNEVLNLCIQNEVHILTCTSRMSILDRVRCSFGRQTSLFYPNLSVLAKNYLSVSSSSVPVEQIFSICGLLLNAKRMSMAPFRANIISVVYDNYPKFFKVTRTAAAPAAESGLH
jgi:hypothetical protein